MKQISVLAAFFIILCSMTVGASTEGGAGIAVDVGSSISDLGNVVIDVVWTQGADEAFLALNAPEGIDAVTDGGRLIAAGDRISVGPVGAGQEMKVEVFGLKEGAKALLVAERIAGSESYQKVIDIRIGSDNTVVAGIRDYRVRPAQERDFAVHGRTQEVPEASLTAELGYGALVVESLNPKIAATVFAEDPANYAIPDGPGNCADSGGVWTVFNSLYISSAPAGATSTAITAHVEITHPVMADLQISFGRSDTPYSWLLDYLWRYDPGVNLNRDFTQNKYNHDFMALGDEVNGYYGLGVRDCAAADTGTLTYFSVLIEYDNPEDFDLIADSVSVDPDPAAPGDDIHVTWSGRVGGADSIVGGFNTRIYLSNDTNITTADTVLATIAENAASDPGDTFGDGAPGRTVTLPAGLSDGTKYIGIIVDYNDAVNESNESNNTAWDSITIDSSSSLDLVADSITPQAGSVAAGASVNVNWFGHLDGASSGDISGNFTVGFYLSNDATVTTGDTLLDRVTINGPTAPGESFGASGRSLTIPGGTASGTRYLGMIVDDTSSVDETNENNNTATSPITVTGGGGGGQPDLAPSGCSVSPSTVDAGAQITVNWTERNLGDAEASPSITKVFISPDQTWEGAGTDPKLGQIILGSLAAGVQQSQSLSGTIPAGTADGSWYILVVMDAAEQVSESNEGNNLCVATITVGSGGGPTNSDRWLVPAAASASGYGGSDWRTQVAITNSTNQARQATIYYVRDSASWPGVLLSGPISIGPRRSYYLDDILATLRPTAGLLYVVFDEAGPVVTSRTYNRASDGSTFGQGIPGIPMGGTAPDELILPMVHSGAGRFHTNLGLVQASTGSMTVEISIYTAGGSLLATQQRTVIDGWDQINDVFDRLGVGGANVEGGWISVRMVGGSPDAWTCYASVVDDETGDPTYVAGVAAQ
jgi:hypothetical protein